MSKVVSILFFVVHLLNMSEHMYASFCSSDINSHKEESKVKANDESPTETMPLQKRLNEINMLTRRSTRMSSVSKTEMEYTPIVLVRDVDRAASLPIEKKSYLFDYTFGEKGRGYSMQRDKVIIFLQIHCQR